MTPDRRGKQVLRAIRSIPLDAIAPSITASESAGRGLWCIVAGDLVFVPPDYDTEITTDWDDMIEHAQVVRWVRRHPERIHDTHESAVAFVRSRLAGPPDPPSQS